MELLFGSHVRSGGRQIGDLAGIEVDPTSRRVTKIIFSKNGTLASETHTRPIGAVSVEKGVVVVADSAPVEVPTGERRVLSRATRVLRPSHREASLSGVVVGANGAMDTLVCGQRWWMGRFRVAAADFDFSQTGEIRAAGSRAA